MTIYMKKFFLSAISAALVFVMAMTTALAEFPDIKYSGSESVDVSWDNMSSIGTLTPGAVSFTVGFNSKSGGASDYNVSCVLDGKTVVSETVNIPPATSEKKSFGFTVSAGIHDVTLSVLKKGAALYDKSEKIYVIKNYERQFMDDTSGRGIGVHYGRTPYKENITFTNDLIELAGLRVVRDGREWEYIETTKGVYDFSYADKFTKDLQKRGMKTYWNVSYGNGKLYLPERGMNPNAGWGTITRHGHPQTQESIQAYSDFTEVVAKYFKDNNYGVAAVETWNEPNGTNPNGTEMAQIFTDYIRPIKIKMLRDGYDDVDIASFTPHNNYQSAFLNGCMQLSFYPHFDRYAAHEYQFKNGFESSNLYDSRIKKLDNFITEYGGWKRIDISETGFTTIDGSNAWSTSQSAAEEVSKLYTICEYNNLSNILLYDLMNDGKDATYSEDNFGAVTYDGKPKPHYLALTNFNNQTSGGIQIGEIETGLPSGTRAFLYYKDGAPVVIAWSNQLDGSEATWNLSGENVTVIDNYGNTIAQNADSVTFGRESVYIKGLSHKWITNAVHHDLVKLNSEWLERYSDLLSDSLKNEVTSEFENAEKAVSNEVTEQQALELFNKYFELGNKIIEAGKNGELEEMQVSTLIYRLYRAAEKLNKLYITLYSGEEIKTLSNRYDECRNKAYEMYYNNLSVKQYSDAILHFIRDYNKDLGIVLKESENPSKPGVLKGYDVMAEALCGWFDAFSEYETVTEIGLTIQTPYYDRRSFVNGNITTEVNLNNFTPNDFTGTICVFDDEGNKISESPRVSVRGNGGYAQTSVSLSTKRPTDDTGCTHYYLSYVDEDGNILYTLRTEYKVTDVFSVSVLPCTETIENLKSVKLKIKNLTSVEQNAHISLESDENFSFKSNNIDATLEGNEEKIVELPVVSIKDTKYHFYSFKYRVTDDSGTLVAENDTTLSFTNIVKTEKPISVEEFDGDISDWQDAYPIYINTPKNVDTNEAWANAECSARAFVKWDSEHLYILADIYDDKYLQPFTAGSMWQGDSIQLSLDPKNDKSTEYKDDDFELGFSYTPLGNEFYSWYAPTKLTMGVVDFFKIVRNDDLHFSRYMISLDKSIISNVDLTNGNKIGFNMAINDNDYLQREGFYEFTGGTAGSKNPSLYADFNFIDTENKERIDGKAVSIFPEKVESSIIQKENAFSDIYGHWAEATINQMAERGNISGMGDGTFAPDKTMTRAEFFAVLSKAAALSGKTASYADVSENDWFAKPVSDVADIIPAAMVGENNEIYPKKAISREEAIYLVSNVYAKKTTVKNVTADCRSYPDGAEVSDWAEGMINLALDKKLMSGSTDGNLYPKGTLTRAEACTIVYNLMLQLG